MALRLIVASTLAANLAACDKPPPVADALPWRATDHDRQAGEDDSEAIRDATGAPEAAADVAGVWAANCVRCHAAGGTGARMPGIPDFTQAAWQRTRSDADLRDAIVTGRGAMPSFDLPEAAVRGLVARIRAFAATSKR